MLRVITVIIIVLRTAVVRDTNLYIYIFVQWYTNEEDDDGSVAQLWGKLTLMVVGGLSHEELGVCVKNQLL